jgi:penicillin-binding protein 2
MNPGSGKHVSIFRLNIIYVVIAIAVIAFVLRLFSLQIIEGEAFQLQADENRLVTITIPAPRGVIYDRNDFQLVRNIPAFNIMITPALLPDSLAEVEAIYQRLSEITGVPVDQEGPPSALCIPGRGILQFVEEGATNRPYEAWPIACDVEEEIGRILREEQADLPGVSVETVPVRDYTTGDLTSNFIGYMGPIPAILEEFYEELGFEADRPAVAGRGRVALPGAGSGSCRKSIGWGGHVAQREAQGVRHQG